MNSLSTGSDETATSSDTVSTTNRIDSLESEIGQLKQMLLGIAETLKEKQSQPDPIDHETHSDPNSAPELGHQAPSSTSESSSDDTPKTNPSEPEPQGNTVIASLADPTPDPQHPVIMVQRQPARFYGRADSVNETQLYSVIRQYSITRRSTPLLESICSTLATHLPTFGADPRFHQVATLLEEWAIKGPAIPVNDEQVTEFISRTQEDLDTISQALAEAFNAHRSHLKRVQLFNERALATWQTWESTSSPVSRVANFSTEIRALRTWLDIPLCDDKVLTRGLKVIMKQNCPLRLSELIADVCDTFRPDTPDELFNTVQREILTMEQQADNLGYSLWSTVATNSASVLVPAQDNTTTDSSVNSTGRASSTPRQQQPQQQQRQQQSGGGGKRVNKWFDKDGIPPHPHLKWCDKHKKWGKHDPKDCTLPTKTQAIDPDEDQYTPVTIHAVDCHASQPVKALLDPASVESWIRLSVIKPLLDAGSTMLPSSGHMQAANNTVTPALGDIVLDVVQEKQDATPNRVEQRLTVHVMHDKDLSQAFILSREASERLARPPISLLDPEEPGQAPDIPAIRTDELHAERTPDLSNTLPRLRQAVAQKLEKHKRLFRPLDKTASELRAMEIEVEQNCKPVLAKPYWLSKSLKEEVDTTVSHLLLLGIIEQSTSSWASPIFFVRQGPKLRMVIDYRKVNAVTPGQPVPITSCEDLLTSLEGMKVFATLDLKSGYHQVAIAEQHRYLTAFVCHLGVYQFTRVPFGLKNAPSHFQSAMMELLHGLIFHACLLYVDDVLVMGRDDEDFLQNLESVLTRLDDANLVLGAGKCDIGVDAVTFLGHMITEHGITIDPARMAPIRAMKPPSSITEVRSALGFFNYFRRFYKNYAKTASPMTALTAKGTPFVWDEATQAAFTQLKEVLLQKPVLAHIDYSKPIIIRSDACDLAVGGALLQPTDNPDEPDIIGFFSATLNAAQRRWSINEKEAFALLRSVEHFKGYVRGHSFTCEVDSHNLIFSTTQSASAKIERWRHRLSDYLLDVRYLPGSENAIADGLSRVGQISNSAACCAITFVPQSTTVPTKEDTISRAHGTALSGHFGRTETVRVLRDHGFNWPSIEQDTNKFIQNCAVCQKTRLKAAIAHHTGNLATTQPFDTIYVDTIGPLAKTEEGHEYIIVGVDGFTRWTEIMSTVTTDAASAAKFVLRRIVARHGLPRRIHSDNGPQYINTLLKTLYSQLGIEHTTSAPYTPQQNGIVERLNSEVVRHIRSIMSTLNVKDWDDTLPVVQFLINNSCHRSIGTTPYALLHGDHISPGRGIPRCLEDIRPRDTPHAKYFDTLRHTIARVRAAARKVQQDDIDLKAKHTENIPVHKVGSFVYASHPKGKRPHKLASHVTGPFRVTGHTGKFYDIASVIDDREYTLHTSRLLECACKDLDEAKRLASSDTDEYPLESVTDHTIVDGEPFLRLHWSGYPESADTWQAYDEDIAGNELVEKYLDAHDLRNHKTEEAVVDHD